MKVGVGLLVVSFFCTACNLQPPPASTAPGRITSLTVCSIPPEQDDGTFQGRFEELPIALIIDRNFYATNQGGQAGAIKAAIETWNVWSRLKGFDVFSINNDGDGVTAGGDIPETDTCEQAEITGSQSTGIGIWKIEAGGSGRNQREPDGKPCKLLPAGIQGKTNWVVTDGIITNVSVIINHDEFNSPGRTTLDLESLVLHELGHVLGLLHSCDPGDGDDTTAISCDEAPIRLTEAVMFPFLLSGQIRRTLQQNDYGRINCLY